VGRKAGTGDLELKETPIPAGNRTQILGSSSP